MKWVEHVAHMGKIRSAYKILINKPEEKKSHGRPRHRYKNNIRMDLWKTCRKM
jgi:hypothetical protein